jgi:hypothetical protein
MLCKVEVPAGYNVVYKYTGSETYTVVLLKWSASAFLYHAES